MRGMDKGVEGLWEAVFENSPDGIFLIDHEGLIRAFNPAMERLTGWGQEEVVGKRECLLIFNCRYADGEMVCRSTCAGLAALANPGSASEAELMLRTKGGKEIVVSASYRFLPIQPGYAIGVMREITAKKQAEEGIRLQAMTDELTGLYNFRYFRRQLDLEIKRAERYRHPLSLLMLDIDEFKHYNDLHGHPQGNEVLRQLAALLRDNTRETNVVARYGGEEFVVLLPETGKWVAIRTAERLCSMIQDAVFPFEKEQPGGNLTVSLGVASYPWDAEEAEGLIQIADAFLYQAKRQGRNRVLWRKI